MRASSRRRARSSSKRRVRNGRAWIYRPSLNYCPDIRSKGGEGHAHIDPRFMSRQRRSHVRARFCYRQSTARDYISTLAEPLPRELKDLIARLVALEESPAGTGLLQEGETTSSVLPRFERSCGLPPIGCWQRPPIALPISFCACNSGCNWSRTDWATSHYVWLG